MFMCQGTNYYLVSVVKAYGHLFSQIYIYIQGAVGAEVVIMPACQGTGPEFKTGLYLPRVILKALMQCSPTTLSKWGCCL